MTATMQKIGSGGAVSGLVGGFPVTFNVLVTDERVMVSSDDLRLPVRGFDVPTPKYGASIGELASRPGFRMAVASTFDDTLLYLFDSEDANFGYAINLTTPDFSEWGYCR